MQSPPSTEQSNSASKNLDAVSIDAIMELMHREDQTVITAVHKAYPEVQKFISAVIAAFKNKGRLFYIGAGTSGRLGVLDASECPPTFSVDPSMVQGIIAGSDVALKSAVEGAEDDTKSGESAVIAAGISTHDIVLGISASGFAPFVKSALIAAKKRGSIVWLLTCNAQYKETQYSLDLDGIILVDTGPEIISGSTRLKAGTATKLVLNMISTIAMIKLGKVYRNLMVDVKPTNNKLKNRACHIIATITKCTLNEAVQLLELSGNQPKVAIVMHLKAVDKQTAEKLLNEHGGFLREVIGNAIT